MIQHMSPSSAATNLESSFCGCPRDDVLKMMICLLANRKFCLLVTRRAGEPKRAWNKEKSSREQFVEKFIIFKAPER